RGDVEVTVRDVLEALNGRDTRQRAYTTLMTTLTRLHGKGLLTRRRQGRTLWYRATMSEQEYRRTRARAEVDALVDAYGEEALVQFTRRVAAQDPRRRAQLRRLARRD
ncbi:MAG TPA: BlaI/MecI/CopY family transcriptional regulator, partial [Conexibacter sp.]|nr:BlaI/MecI/CopY family transcriptional regulator [Conexibacter sp.]